MVWYRRPHNSPRPHHLIMLLLLSCILVSHVRPFCNHHASHKMISLPVARSKLRDAAHVVAVYRDPPPRLGQHSHSRRMVSPVLCL